jgi:hypothetical protein
MLSKIRRHIPGHLPQGQKSLFNLCTECENLCQSSKLLNDPDYGGSVRERGEKALQETGKDSDELPHVEGFLTDRIRDCNQWNDEETYLFDEEIPHHMSGRALQASAGKGCHLCNLLWAYLSTERYGILEQEVRLDIAKLAEESRETARRELLLTKERLYARVGMKIGSQGGYLAIVLYAGQQNERLPDLRSALAVWRTKGVSGKLYFETETMRLRRPSG